MRDINRIDPFLQKLGEVWKESPDLRFGQLIMNIKQADPSVIWNMEEEQWLEAIEEFSKTKNKNN